jgi:hypothetical protein
MIVLDNAVLSNCDVKDVILKLSFTEDNKPVTLTKKINDYYSKRCINGYRVNFIKDVSVFMLDKYHPTNENSNFRIRDVNRVGGFRVFCVENSIAYLGVCTLIYLAYSC